MSAWDVAGAVVWTSVALLLWAGIFFAALARGTMEIEEVGFSLAIAVMLSLASVFCIARLFGAHL